MHVEFSDLSLWFAEKYDDDDGVDDLLEGVEAVTGVSTKKSRVHPQPLNLEFSAIGEDVGDEPARLQHQPVAELSVIGEIADEP